MGWGLVFTMLTHSYNPEFVEGLVKNPVIFKSPQLGGSAGIQELRL